VAFVLLGVFSFLALALAAVGIYGVTSYSVTQRTHEIGIRIALGAGRFDVLKVIGGKGLLPAMAGVAVGAVAALGLTRFLTGILYGVRPTELLTYTAVAALLIAVAALASFFPARRAAEVDPVVALRHE
jgi:putative ABC transport system permease protein